MDYFYSGFQSELGGVYRLVELSNFLCRCTETSNYGKRDSAGSQCLLTQESRRGYNSAITEAGTHIHVAAGRLGIWRDRTITPFLFAAEFTYSRTHRSPVSTGKGDESSALHAEHRPNFVTTCVTLVAKWQRLLWRPPFPRTCDFHSNASLSHVWTTRFPQNRHQASVTVAMAGLVSVRRKPTSFWTLSHHPALGNKVHPPWAGSRIVPTTVWAGSPSFLPSYCRWCWTCWTHSLWMCWVAFQRISTQSFVATCRVAVHSSAFYLLRARVSQTLQTSETLVSVQGHVHRINGEPAQLMYPGPVFLFLTVAYLSYQVLLLERPLYSIPFTESSGWLPWLLTRSVHWKF